ncbi:hypothetical protein [Aeromicrobium piscarium]|uniref:hypothetical protein n=1 Tax=Aeromicrobium piscarium TaxID=2590901 RepID=UPI00163DC688|nr:hypothetical protein [Aeromicrobium piscarium]
MAKFTASVLLRDPATGQVVTFHKGDSVPDWAKVGDHVVEHQQGQAKAPAKKAEPKPEK